MPDEMSKEELEKRKLQAEIEKIKSETVRWSERSSKVIGAWVLGIGGAIAAVSTYQLTEQKAEVAKVHLEQANAKLLDAEAKLQTKQEEIEGLEASIATKKAALAETQKLAEATEAKIKQSLDELNERLRTTQLSADARSEVSRIVATQEVVKKAAQDTVSRVGAAIEQSERSPMVLVFADPSDTENDAVQAVATTLEKNGFTLGRKKVFPGRPPNGVTEVRYFRNPEDRDEAQKILGILKSAAHLSDGRISFVVDRDIKQSRYFEVRLAKKPFVLP